MAKLSYFFGQDLGPQIVIAFDRFGDNTLWAIDEAYHDVW
jgi:hypothetical protein